MEDLNFYGDCDAKIEKAEQPQIGKQNTVSKKATEKKEAKTFLKEIYKKSEASRKQIEKSHSIKRCDCRVVENAGLLYNDHSACYERFCCNHKCKEFPLGSVAYFICDEKLEDLYIPEKAKVHFGIVQEHFSDRTALQLYKVNVVEKIDGVPTSEIFFPTEWVRLPKKWDYNTSFFKLTYERDERAKEVFINSPESIIEGIKSGALIKQRNIHEYTYGIVTSDDPQFRKEIDIPKGCYRIERKYGQGFTEHDTISLYFNRLFHTYEEAKQSLDEIITRRKNEIERITNLTDYEYAVEEIERVVNLYQGLCKKSDEEANQYKDWLLSLKNIERVEVRLHYQEIQWRYTIPAGYKSCVRKSQKWNYIDLRDTTHWSNEAFVRHLSE